MFVWEKKNRILVGIPINFKKKMDTQYINI